MKLKQLAEDFKVEEITNIIPSQEKRDYKFYLLEKKSMETFSLLSYLSKKNKIPIEDFGIGGIKDRHAITKQYITVPSKYELDTLKEKNFSISFLGYSDKRLKPGELKGNKFEITVRDVKKGEFEGIYKKAKSIEKIKVPNYFDSQRFGSVINNRFIAKHIIKKNYEQAVKAYITQFSKYESSRVKEEKRYILQNWGNILKINARVSSLAVVVNQYKKTHSWLEAYKKIPPGIREIVISAYQSYLWNECTKEIFKRRVNKKSLYPIKYNLGHLIFYKNLTEDEIKNMPLTFETISDEIKPAGFEKEIIDKILSIEGVKVEEFNIKRQVGNFFKSHGREVLLKPLEFRIKEPTVDELNDKGKGNRFKIKLAFALPKGSYATIITKRIFNH